MKDDDIEPDPEQGFASSPCMMHEFDEDEAEAAPPSVDDGDAAAAAPSADDGESDAAAPSTPGDVASWRRAERQRQLKRRAALNADLRQRYSLTIARNLEDAIGDVAGLVVSCYWPMRGEPDLRGFMDGVARSGGRCALPVVTERNRALEFRSWRNGERLERGFWNIPVPAGGDEVVPDVVIAPVVAFDRARFRLGYGGGYFDRTLGKIIVGRRVFGVGYSMAAIETIRPQPHDIPMDAIVTELGVR